MGRIVTHVAIKNLIDTKCNITFDALVDTGAAHMVLPLAWKERLGKLNKVGDIDCETATQELIKGEICGSVEIKLEGFDPICNQSLIQTSP